MSASIAALTQSYRAPGWAFTASDDEKKRKERTDISRRHNEMYTEFNTDTGEHTQIAANKHVTKYFYALS